MKSKLVSLLSGGLVGFFTSGCLTYQMPVHPRLAIPLPEQDSPALVSSTRSFTHQTLSLREMNDSFTFTEVSVSADHRPLRFDYFEPHVRKGVARPALIILPILGGKQYTLEHYFARYFAEKGYMTVVAKRPNVREEVKHLEDIDSLLCNSVVDVRQLYDWLERQPGADTNRFGLFGVSFGAIRGALVLAHDARPKAAVLGMPGGDIPDILGHTTEKGLVKIRTELLAKHAFSLPQGMEHIRGTVTLEPLRFAPSIDPARVLCVLAAYDTVVPYTNGLRLREALGRPKTHVYPAGHYSILPFVPCIRRQAYDFFETRFHNERR